MKDDHPWIKSRDISAEAAERRSKGRSKSGRPRKKNENHPLFSRPYVENAVAEYLANKGKITKIDPSYVASRGVGPGFFRAADEFLME